MRKKSTGLFLLLLLLLLPGKAVLAAPKDVTASFAQKRQVRAMASLFADACGLLMEEAPVGKSVKLSFVSADDRRKLLAATAVSGEAGMDAVTLSRRLFDHATLLPEDTESGSIGNVDLTVERILQLSRGKYRVEGTVYRNAGKKKTEEFEWGSFRLNLTVREHTYFGFAATELTCKKTQEFYVGSPAYDAKAGSDIVRTALRYVGGKYVWGGSSLKTGVDCSGFVYCILTATGHYHGGRLHSSDWANVGEAVVNLKDARAGDVIVWDGHVAIYMGGGRMVHASNSAPYPKGGIKVSRISTPRTYGSHPFLGVRRVR